MFTRTRIAAVVAACAAAAALPAVANAQNVPLRGVVSGSPYGASNGQMAIPVLFSKQTASGAHLKSPVGVIIVKRTTPVKLPNGGGYTIPVNLRTGDRFKGFGEVGSLQQKVFYPRVVFSKPVVYFRSKELSLSELSAAVAQLRASLIDLTNQLNALRDGSVKAFQDIYNQLTQLKAALAALKIPTSGVDLSSIQSQIDALNAKLNSLIAGLPDFSKFALLSQIPDVSGFLNQAQVQALINAALAGLNIPTTQDIQNLIDQSIANLNLSSTYATITALTNVNTTLTNANTALTNRLNALCTKLNTPTVLAILGIANLNGACS